MASGTFLGVNHYRFYELDHSDHIEAGYSVECGSDADAVRAAGRLLENSPAAAVEVWQGPGRVIMTDMRSSIHRHQPRPMGLHRYVAAPDVRSGNRAG